MTHSPVGGQIQADPAASEIADWRLRRLLDAGFPVSLARRLATAADCDLHALLELVDRGCPPHLAARILAPIDDPSKGSEDAG